ncbi:MAG: DUF1811 family protein [Firmicutes bacterium]|nr:DUF1811 family protein [Bacillota bacterium]
MSQRLLSEMNPQDLQNELVRCQALGKKAMEEGLISEYRVWEQRYYLARSYLMDPQAIILGATYGLADTTGLFIARRLNGVFAYGTVLGENEERGFPIGQLVPLDFSQES